MRATMIEMWHVKPLWQDIAALLLISLKKKTFIHQALCLLHLPLFLPNSIMRITIREIQKPNFADLVQNLHRKKSLAASSSRSGHIGLQKIAEPSVSSCRQSPEAFASNGKLKSNSTPSPQNHHNLHHTVPYCDHFTWFSHAQNLRHHSFIHSSIQGSVCLQIYTTLHYGSRREAVRAMGSPTRFMCRRIQMQACFFPFPYSISTPLTCNVLYFIAFYFIWETVLWGWSVWSVWSGVEWAMLMWVCVRELKCRGFFWLHITCISGFCQWRRGGEWIERSVDSWGVEYVPM